MKKLLALTLSLLMVFAVVPMVMVSAYDYSATIFTMDEGSRPSYTDVTLRTDYTSYVDSGEEGYGNVLKVLRKGSRGDTQDQALGIKLPANLWTAYGNPVSITFDARTDSGYINFGPNESSEYIYLNNSIEAIAVSGYTAPIGDFSPTWKTYTFDLTTAKSKASIANGDMYLCFRNTWGNNTCNYYYIDNVKFNYAPFVATFTGASEADQVVSADSNATLITPTATLAEGEFAGWTTEEDPDTIIPAGTEITIAKDTTYFATATERVNQDAPAAPVVENKSGESVTLVANSAYQYSMDGENWQTSNVFTGLKPGTSYTFYQRLKATATKYASPASPALQVETAVILFWKFYDTSSSVLSDFNVVTTPASGAAAFSVGTHSDNGTPSAMYTSRALVVGDKLTFTSKESLVAGIYKVTYQVRTYNGRAKTKVVVNGREYGEFNPGVNSNGKGQKFVLFEDLEIAENTPAVIELTATTSGSCYIEGMHFEKVGEVTPPEVDGETTDVLSTDEAASIRLGEVNGIRFYTTINTDALATLVGDKEYEIGTLIAPVDVAGEYLTVDDNCAVVPYNMTNDLWEGNQVVGSIVNIKEANYNREFVARAYVLVDGVYYYSDSVSVRTIAGIADAYIADTNAETPFDALDAETKALVEKWAAAND